MRPLGSKNGIHNKTINTCEVCGRGFLTYPSRTRRYCTEACYQNSRRGKRILTCKGCNKSFEKYESELLSRESGIYCSFECRYALGRIESTCEYCGVIFSIVRSRVDSGRGRYCSVACMRAANPAKGGSIKRECENCKAIFYVNPYIVEQGYGRFCGRSCSMTGDNNPQWVGGHTKIYGAEWTRGLRKSIRGRDNYKCQICGCEGIDVHHIDYDKFNNLPSNLITLCHSCHTKTNTERDWWEKHFVGKLEEALAIKTHHSPI